MHNVYLQGYNAIRKGQVSGTTSSFIGGIRITYFRE